MILEEQLQSETTQTDLNVPHTHESTYPHGLNVQTHVEQKNDYFIAKVRPIISPPFPENHTASYVPFYNCKFL